MTANYLLGLSEMKRHPNAELADLRLSDGMIDLQKSGRVGNALLCELATRLDFIKPDLLKNPNPQRGRK